MEHEVYWNEDTRDYVTFDNLGAEIPLYVDTLAEAQKAAALVFGVAPEQIVEAGVVTSDGEGV